MMIHPCGNSIPTALAAKYIAICDMIFGLIGIFWFIFILEGYGYIAKDEMYEYLYETDEHFQPTRIRVVSPNPFNKSSTNAGLHSMDNITIKYYSIFNISPNGIAIDGELGNICLSGLYTSLNVALFVLLLNAINKRSIPKLTVWFWVRLIILLIKCIILITYMALGLSVLTQTPHTIFMFVHLYGLWIVGTLIKEIKEEKRSAASPPATVLQLADSPSNDIQGYSYILSYK